MSQAHIAALAVAVLLMLAASVLAMAETSLTHLSRARARAIEEDGEKGARHLSKLLDRRETYLNPVLLAVLVFHLAAATLVAVVAHSQWGLQGVIIALVVEVIVMFVVAEAAPKTWALQSPAKAAALAAPLVTTLAGFPPLRWITNALVVLARWFVPGQAMTKRPIVSEEELLAFAGVAAEADVINEDEQELIKSIIEFGDTLVREVMVPRPDIVSVSADYRVADVMEIFAMNGLSRIPACGHGLDEILGVAYAKDLMRADLDGRGDDKVSEILREAHFVPESKSVSSLLREMQAEQYHIAIVVDEFGVTAGLVTLEDLIEELVGEIVDEFDVEDPMLEPAGAGVVRVNARVSIDEVNELLGVDLPEGDWDTLGGLVLDFLGHIPTDGETVEVAGLTLRAEKVQGRRIGRVRIEKSDSVDTTLASGDE